MATGDILVVDDEESVLVTLQAVLEGEGYAVATAQTRTDALALLQERTFDVVVSDLHLDEGDGHAVVAEAKRTSPDTATIILTGFATLDDAIRAISEGAHEFLLKPTDLDRLKLVVARGVERRRLARDVQSQLTALAIENARLLAESLAAARAREQLIATVARDLKDPLQAIAETAERLERQVSGDPEDIAEIRVGLAQLAGTAARTVQIIEELASKNGS